MTRPDPREFDLLVRQHHAAVLRAALRVASDAGAAADVAQEVFVQVLRGRVRLSSARDVRGVLCWLATRLARNVRRAEARRDRHERSTMNPAAATAADPLVTAVDAELAAALAAGLALLPRELRLPVCLRCEDGLAFAAIGDALAIPESTAHERFTRGIARLRQHLAGCGFAVTATAVASAIAEGVPPRVPALEARLLRFARGGLLGVATMAGRVVLSLAAACALVATALAGTFPWDPAPTASERVGVGEVSVPAAAAEPAASPGVRTPVPQDPRPAPVPPPQRAAAELAGSVHDADGAAAVGVRVEAVASGGLKPFALGEVRTGEGGAFVLRLDAARLGLLVHKLRLRVLDGETLLFEGDDLTLAADGGAIPAQALVLPAAAGTQATRYGLIVAVRDAGGAPVAGATVRVYAGESAPERPGHGSCETMAKTAANGDVELTGRSFGSKWLFVDGRSAGAPAVLERFAIDAARTLQRTVTLPTPRRVVVDLADVEGTRLAGVTVWLEDAIGVQHVPVAAGEALAFVALADGVYTLRASGWPWSPVLQEVTVPAPADLRIRLKRFDDPRAVGDHMPEVHGRLVDAKTGETVPFGSYAITTFARLAGASSLATDLVLPPPPVQTMSDGQERSEFHLTGLAVGGNVIVVRIPGYANTVWAIDLAAGECRAEVAIPLEAAGELAGRVVDAAGNGVSGVQVHVVGIGPAADAVLQAAKEAKAGHWPRVALCRATTKADGSFALAGVPPGIALRIVAAAEGHGLAVSPPNLLRAGERVQNLVVRLPER